MFEMVEDLMNQVHSFTMRSFDYSTITPEWSCIDGGPLESETVVYLMKEERKDERGGKLNMLFIN